MAGDWSDLTKKIARGLAEVKKTTGSELLAESLPVALAGRTPAAPVVQHRLKRNDGSERFVLILPFGEGEVRIDLTRAEYAALTQEMVRFWNEEGPKPLPAVGQSAMDDRLSEED